MQVWGQPGEYMSMRVWGQPGEYVRLKGVDVHTYTNRPTSANPAINRPQCNYLGAMMTNILKICKYCVQDRSHNQILVEIFLEI